MKMKDEQRPGKQMTNENLGVCDLICNTRSCTSCNTRQSTGQNQHMKVAKEKVVIMRYTELI